MSTEHPPAPPGAPPGILGAVLAFSIEHRIAVVLATLLAASTGIVALFHLPIDAVPDITNKQVQINTEVPSLSPVEIEKQVTFAIETALSGIPGLSRTRSLSRNGFSQVTAVFEDRTDVYFARQQVSERLAEIRESLPPGSDPRMGPISTGLGEVLMWTVEFLNPDGLGAPLAEGRPGWQPDGTYLAPEGERLATPVEKAAYLRTVQDWIIRFQMKSVPGVAGIDSIGGFEKQYHVNPDPVRLIAFGLGFQDLVDALERNNVSTGAGYIEHHGEAYQVRAAGRIRTTGEIAAIVVGEREGTPIRIRDVATVAIGPELRTGSASTDGREAVVGTALMRMGENSRVVARDVRRRLAEIQKTLPPGIVARVVLDRSRLVEATVGTVERNLAEGAILVIVVLFLMLGHLRAAVVTALAIPLSMLFTATGMIGMGISGNLMSLGAIDFGLIVDGAVIIVENCLRCLAERRKELGRLLTEDERLAVVRDATQQVRTATAFGEAIIVTVYLPILALTGIEGKMFHPMAATVILALVAAFVLSLTFVPAMVAIAVSGPVVEHESRLLARIGRLYARVLDLAIRRRKAVVAAAIGLFAASSALFSTLGQEFVPRLDEHDLAIHAMRIPSTGLAQSTRMQLEVEKALVRVPEVAKVFSKTGTAEMASDPMPPTVSDTFVILHPTARWPDPRLSKAGLLEKLSRALAEVPGNNYEFTQPIEMRFNELIAGVRSDVAVKVFGDEFEDLTRTAERIARVLREVPGAADVKVEQTQGLPVLEVEVDRDTSGRYGLSVSDVQEIVAIGVGGREAGLVFEGDRRFDIVVRLPEAIRDDLDALRNLPVALPADPDSSEGSIGIASLSPRAETAFVPLAAVARLESGFGINQVSRENGKRRVVVQANVRGRDLGSFVAAAQARIGEKITLPSGCWIQWGGQFENLQAAKARLALVVPLCFLLIFALLYGTFGSLRHAAMVFTGVPLGLSGGVLALALRGMPFSISAGVGFIALSGIAVLNGLVMVTFINQLRAHGRALDEAIVFGSLVRLRPVLMTALVASLGFVPMALATSTGAEVQRPLATVVIGGLASSTFLTLVVLPALYRLVEGWADGPAA